MSKIVHYTDFALLPGEQKERERLNGWRLYNQHAGVSFRKHPKEENKCVLYNNSNSGADLRPGIIMYKVISGYAPGTKVKFLMVASYASNNNPPRLSVRYGTKIVVPERQLTADFVEYGGEFVVEDEGVILAIENAVAESAGNDFYMSQLNISVNEKGING
ncbi:hypothetical protein I5S84_02965 [Pseudomonas putida]|uniref:Uncharacterized protein n=1 Tax=Pseudomonas putida TaxID=303 RepID=A0ABD7BEB8_PSEPU|nr:MULTISPECIES: hypothetical protein [Pseudomonas]EKT4560115.1 hypothetical protein [Pseudomonas putida]MBH3447809.1 hypothetical protein [Pseudomonas putida]MBH3473395.1 hypothetical protein [Pseudomonas putida]MCE0780461.1 hypothetical protein [Pseudomonas sp. NMI542_15]MDP9537636.1 hypothetical protein [Pseudomonas putida]